MKNANQGTPAQLNGKGLRIGVIRARFNDDITSSLSRACHAELQSLGVSAEDIEEFTVPGALEVPVALKAMAETGDYDALVAVGCIIRGETYHFELVANESGAGVMRVSLDHQLPIANVILTVENVEQAWARVEEKGRDAARVAVEMALLMDELS